ncbi:hypothetical protein D918_01191 [Trichuris suis]|nr:hypothetical protein D918_01191 [Trichuris suis]
MNASRLKRLTTSDQDERIPGESEFLQAPLRQADLIFFKSNLSKYRLKEIQQMLLMEIKYAEL